jgi:proline racemase
MTKSAPTLFIIFTTTIAATSVMTLRQRRESRITMLIMNEEKNVMMSEEFRSISELRKLLASNCKIEKVYPQVFASDAEVNVVTVTLKCPDGKTQTIRAYREEAHAVREFLRTCT